MSLLVHILWSTVIGNELKFNPFFSIQPKPIAESSEESSLENNLQLNSNGNREGD